MFAQTFAHILKQACTALTFVTMTAMQSVARPESHNTPPLSHSSEQIITLYTTGVTLPRAGASSSQAGTIFTSQGPIGRSSSWLRVLAHPGTLEPGVVTVIDEQFQGAKEFGLPLVGKLQGVYVTSLTDNSSHMVAVKALFADEDAENSLRFFGIHHDDRQECQIAVVGGTGRYSSATGFVVVQAADVPARGGNVSRSRALSFRVHLN